MKYTAQYGKGYGGKLGHRAWMASITGTCSKFGFKRVFLSAERAEREHFNRARTVVTLTWELPVGLYEVSEANERRFIFSQSTCYFGVSRERAQAIAALLDTGMSVNDARKATREKTEGHGPSEIAPKFGKTQ